MSGKTGNSTYSPTLRAQVLGGTKWTLISNVLSVPSRFAISIILVRYLSRQDYGTYRIVLDLSAAMIYLVSLGIQHSISRYVPEMLERRQFSSIVRMIGGMLGLRLVVNLILLTVLALSWRKLFEFFNLPLVLASSLSLILLYILLQRTVEVFGEYFHTAYMDLRTQTIHDSIKDIAFICGIVATGLWNWRLQGVLWTLVASELVGLAVYGSSTLKHAFNLMKWQDRESAEKTPLPIGRIVHYSGYNMLYTFSGLVVGVSIDSFIVAKFMGMDQVALYTFGLGLIMMVHSLNPLTFFKPIFNNIFIRKYTQTGDKTILSRGMAFSVKLGLFIALPGLAGVCLLADPIIRYIYRPDYLIALPVIYLFAIMFLFRCLNIILTFVVNTLELVKYFTWLYIAGLIKLAAAIALTWLWGIVGMAIATCSVEIIWSAMLVYIVKIKGGIPLKLMDRSYASILLNTSLMSLFVLALRGWIGGLVSLFSIVVAGICIYFGLSLVKKPFCADEREMVNTFLKRKIMVF